MKGRNKRIRVLIELVILFVCLGRLDPGFAGSFDNNNAAYFYKKAYSLAVFPTDEGWQDNAKELKETLLKNQVAIAEFKKATELKSCDYTFGKPIKKDMTTLLPRYDEVKLAKLIVAEARLYEKENKTDLALENYLAVLKFVGHLEQQKDFILLSKMTEIVAQESIYLPLSEYIKREDISAQNYQILLDGLISLRNKKMGLSSAFEEEKVFLKNTGRIFAQEAKEKDQYEEAFYQKFYQEYDKLIDEYIGYLITAFKENKLEIFEERYSQFQKELEKETKPLNLAWSAIKSKLGFQQQVDSATLTARSLVSLALPRFSRTITSYHVSVSQLNILITAVAIKLYQLENAKIPASLQELIPTYLAKLPEDPFDDFKPLKYKKKDLGCIVYSLGPDKKGDIKLQLKGRR